MGKTKIVLNVRVDVPYNESVFRIGSINDIKEALTTYFGPSVGRLDISSEYAGIDCTRLTITFLDGYQDAGMLTTEYMKKAFADLISDRDRHSLVALMVSQV